MVTFCTFGVVQSFGVYQDYYTVSQPYILSIIHANKPIANVFKRAFTISDQSNWVIASFLRLRSWTAGWKII